MAMTPQELAEQTRKLVEFLQDQDKSEMLKKLYFEETARKFQNEGHSLDATQNQSLDSMIGEAGRFQQSLPNSAYQPLRPLNERNPEPKSNSGYEPLISLQDRNPEMKDGSLNIEPGAVEFAPGKGLQFNTEQGIGWTCATGQLKEPEAKQVQGLFNKGYEELLQAFEDKNRGPIDPNWGDEQTKKFKDFYDKNATTFLKAAFEGSAYNLDKVPEFNEDNFKQQRNSVYQQQIPESSQYASLNLSEQQTPTPKQTAQGYDITPPEPQVQGYVGVPESIEQSQQNEYGELEVIPNTPSPKVQGYESGNVPVQNDGYVSIPKQDDGYVPIPDQKQEADGGYVHLPSTPIPTPKNDVYQSLQIDDPHEGYQSLPANLANQKANELSKMPQSDEVKKVMNQYEQPSDQLGDVKQNTSATDFGQNPDRKILSQQAQESQTQPELQQDQTNAPTN